MSDQPPMLTQTIEHAQSKLASAALLTEDKHVQRALDIAYQALQSCTERQREIADLHARLAAVVQEMEQMLEGIKRTGGQWEQLSRWIATLSGSQDPHPRGARCAICGGSGSFPPAQEPGT